jgi:hypothetical protein
MYGKLVVSPFSLLKDQFLRLRMKMPPCFNTELKYAPPPEVVAK